MLVLLAPSAVALTQRAWQRRQVVAGSATAAIGAEAGWRQAVAAAGSGDVLPVGAIEALEAGRCVVVKNWLPAAEISALYEDATASFAAGRFKADALASYGKKTKAGTMSGFDPANDRMVMPSFSPSTCRDGPWVDPAVGNFEARMAFRARMAQLKAMLSRELSGRPTLAANGPQTHEMSYTRYGPGAFLPRHTDEHHAELKKAHSVASGDENLLRLEAAKRPPASRRSVTWLVYLNSDWEARSGGALRLHERAQPSAAAVGARGDDLQIGWLRAMRPGASGALVEEQPVFLDANRGGRRNCMLYACGSDGSRRDLSAEPFAASPALYLAGGDFFARALLIDAGKDAERFHLIDAPKSAGTAAAAALLKARSGGGLSDEGEDGGERVRDVLPEGGTLVLFDSVSIPHEVMPTRGRERFAMSGWFHEQIKPA